MDTPEFIDFTNEPQHDTADQERADVFSEIARLADKHGSIAKAVALLKKARPDMDPRHTVGAMLALRPRGGSLRNIQTARRVFPEPNVEHLEAADQLARELNEWQKEWDALERQPEEYVQALVQQERSALGELEALTARARGGFSGAQKLHVMRERAKLAELRRRIRIHLEGQGIAQARDRIRDENSWDDLAEVERRLLSAALERSRDFHGPARPEASIEAVLEQNGEMERVRRSQREKILETLTPKQGDDVAQEGRTVGGFLSRGLEILKTNQWSQEPKEPTRRKPVRR